MPVYNATTASRFSPVMLTPGCPFRSVVGKAEQLYFTMNRTRLGLRLGYSWAYDTATTLISVYGYNRRPFYLGNTGGAYYEHYSWPSASSGSRTWYEDQVEAKDVYHCATHRCLSYCGAGAPDGMNTACVDPFAEENSGLMRITQSGWFNAVDEIVVSTHTYSWAAPGYYIQPEQLQAVKDIWTQNCWVTQQYLPRFPSTIDPHWRRQDHVNGKYSLLSPWPYKQIFNTTGSERDASKVPFCDWMYGVAVANLTTNDCENIDHVTCDDSGNVVELTLSGRGLIGPLSGSFNALDKLTYLSLSSNQLTGQLPSSIFSSGDLEQLYVTSNSFTGSIPCPTHGEPALRIISLARNKFTGAFPACIFENAPRLTSLSLDYLSLSEARIPSEIALATELSTFSAVHAGLAGPLPDALRCMSKLSFLTVPGNHLSGALSQEVFDGMHAIYSLDLRDNQIGGNVPHIKTHHTSLRRMYLDDNKFKGELLDQLTEFANAQEAGALSEVTLRNNLLSGPLPSIYYNLTTNALRISTLNAVGNAYRCEPTGGFPDWTNRIGDAAASFGTCTPVARPTFAINAVPGQYMTVYGTNFMASDELKCLVGENGPIMNGLYHSPTQIRCMTPTGVAGTRLPLRVANHGADFGSPETISGYVEVYVSIASSPPPSPPPPRPPPYVIPPPPPRPPPTPPGLAKALVLTTVIAGTVDTFDEAAQARYKEELAAAIGGGVQGDDIVLVVEAASLKVTASITVPPSVNFEQVRSSVEELTVEDLTRQLTGVEVQSLVVQPTAVFVTVSPKPPPPPPSPPPQDGGSDTGTVVAVAIAGVITISLLVFAAYRKLRSELRKKPISVVVRETASVTAVSTTAVSTTSASDLKVVPNEQELVESHV